MGVLDKSLSTRREDIMQISQGREVQAEETKGCGTARRLVWWRRVRKGVVRSPVQRGSGRGRRRVSGIAGHCKILAFTWDGELWRVWSRATTESEYTSRFFLVCMLNTPWRWVGGQGQKQRELLRRYRNNPVYDQGGSSWCAENRPDSQYT